MNKPKIMTVKEIEATIRDLAKSVGYYGRLLKFVKEHRSVLMEIKKLVKPRTTLDVVLFLEQWGV